ncbi:hypothetical protein OPV22_003049 [Ensete ventricosum]|uniref:Uncharacterized protein n=1 Tax=Ensete ventricosum TaxID=4639 RepID=A0AAV8RZR5_ENSVE|nr:hypothetical protein OPV22_003049 [Ensete ventricosum]
MKVQGEAVCFSISKYWSMSCRDPMMEEAAQKKSRNWLFACLCGVQSRRPQETRATMDVSDEERSSNGLRLLVFPSQKESRFTQLVALRGLSFGDCRHFVSSSKVI